MGQHAVGMYILISVLWTTKCKYS